MNVLNWSHCYQVDATRANYSGSMVSLQDIYMMKLLDKYCATQTVLQAENLNSIHYYCCKFARFYLWYWIQCVLFDSIPCISLMSNTTYYWCCRFTLQIVKADKLYYQTSRFLAWWFSRVRYIHKYLGASGQVWCTC